MDNDIYFILCRELLEKGPHPFHIIKNNCKWIKKGKNVQERYVVGPTQSQENFLSKSTWAKFSQVSKFSPSSKLSRRLLISRRLAQEKRSKFKERKKFKKIDFWGKNKYKEGSSKFRAKIFLFLFLLKIVQRKKGAQFQSLLTP